MARLGLWSVGLYDSQILSSSYMFKLQAVKPRRTSGPGIQWPWQVDFHGQDIIKLELVVNIKLILSVILNNKILMILFCIPLIFKNILFWRFLTVWRKSFGKFRSFCLNCKLACMLDWQWWEEIRFVVWNFRMISSELSKITRIKLCFEN